MVLDDYTIHLTLGFIFILIKENAQTNIASSLLFEYLANFIFATTSRVPAKILETQILIKINNMVTRKVKLATLIFM